MAGGMKNCVTSYDHYCTIQEIVSTATADGSGFIDRTNDDNWKIYEGAYCSVMSRGGREFWRVDQVTADVTHVWKCPWSTKLDTASLANGTEMRLVNESNVYNIVSMIDVDLAHEEIEIQTKRAV